MIESYQRGLQSLVEIALPLLSHLQVLAERWPTADVIVPIGSRGSLPLFWFLQAACNGGLLGSWNPMPIRVVFSIENLSEILASDSIADPPFRESERFPERDVRGLFYAEIATRIQERIENLARTTSNPVLVLDMDEVNTLSNLSERSKIYRRVQLQDDIQYRVISVIGSGRHNVKPGNEQEFRGAAEKWSNSFSHFEIVVPSWISWSDDEPFFDQIGIHYPGIAIPRPGLVSNLVRKIYRDVDGEAHNGFALFFQQFFRHFAKHLFEAYGIDGWMAYLPVSSEVKQATENTESVLEASSRAFFEAVVDCEKQNALKRQFVPMPVDLDEASGRVLDARNGRELLQCRFRDAIGRLTKFRYPFALLVESDHAERDRAIGEIKNLMSSLPFRYAERKP